MDIKSQLADHKRKSAIINDFAIDSKHLAELLPQIFSNNAQSSPEFNSACRSLHEICDDVEKELQDIRGIIPDYKAEQK